MARPSRRRLVAGVDLNAAATIAAVAVIAVRTRWRSGSSRQLDARIGDGLIRRVHDVTVTGTSRWVRALGTLRATDRGFALWEFDLRNLSVRPVSRQRTGLRHPGGAPVGTAVGPRSRACRHGPRTRPPE